MSSPLHAFGDQPSNFDAPSTGTAKDTMVNKGDLDVPSNIGEGDALPR